MLMAKTEFSEFLSKEMLRIQFERGRRLNIAEFAKILGVSPAAVSLWMNGDRKPEKSSIDKLARVLKPEIYDVLDLPRPDPDLEALTNLWPSIPPEKRQAIREDAQNYVSENEPKTQSKRRPSEKHS